MGAGRQHRAAQGDDARHQVGTSYGDAPGEHAAQAVSDQHDALPGFAVDHLDLVREAQRIGPRGPFGAFEMSRLDPLGQVGQPGGRLAGVVVGTAVATTVGAVADRVDVPRALKIVASKETAR